KARQVVLEGTERDVVELLARPFGDREPAVRMALRVKAEPAVLFLGVEAEQPIELLGLGDVADHQVEMIERMHAELAGAAHHGLSHRADLGHGKVLDLPGKYALARPSANAGLNGAAM